MVIFGGKVITSRGPLSLYVDLCALYQIHQKKSWQGLDPPPPLLDNARILRAFCTATPPLYVNLISDKVTYRAEK